MGDYVLSPFAEDDLREINRYTIRRHGIEQFRTYRAYINKGLKELAENPLRPRTKSRDDLVEGCRSYHVQHHYIFYRIREGQVEVGRVLHGAMNFEDHLSKGLF